MPQFTKGKWRAVYYTPKYITINGGIYLISSNRDDDIAFTPSLSDAMLIVAAPEMYRLLYKTLNSLFRKSPDDPLWREIEECLCRIDGIPVPRRLEQDV